MSRWIESDAKWYEQRMVHCACCGRLIAKHFLIASVEGEEQIFCSEGCEELYRDYVRPVRGKKFAPPPGLIEQYEGLMVK